MSPDLIAASLALVAALIWATRGDARALRDFVDQHSALREAQRPTARPSVSAQGRPVSPFAGPLRPRAIEWVDAELLPDPVQRPALERYPLIVVDAQADPLPARAQPPALTRRPRAIEPRRRAIDPPRSPGDRGAVRVHALLVAAAGLAVVLIVMARLTGIG